MHPFFEPLERREVMLLLTTLTLGGSESVGIFSALPADQRARLDEKARALLELPKDKRVQFMVREMKQAIAFKGLRGVERVDPSWILQALKGESPRIVATVLISLPNNTVRSVLKRLPPAIRKALPPRDEIKRTPVELVRAVRQVFESRFSPMPPASTQNFYFHELIQLDKTELFRVMRELGLIELGQAFVSVGKMALAELCRRLPRDKAEELILAVRSASRIDLPNLKSAQRFLSRIVVNFKDTEEFFQKAGLWRLAKASLIEEPHFRAAFAQRLPRDAGELYLNFVEKAVEERDQGLEDFQEEPLKRLQDTIVARVEDLSQRGQIGSQWATMTAQFHFERPILHEPEPEPEDDIPPPDIPDAEPPPDDLGEP